MTLLALLLAVPVSVAAEESPKKTLGCEAAVQRALDGGLARGRLQRSHARARAEALEAWPALELRARTGYPDSLESTRAGVRLNLPVPGLGAAEAEGWRGRGEEAEAEAQLALLEVALVTREAHLAVRVARAELAWLEEDHRLGEARLAGLRRQVGAGLETTMTLAREALAVDEAGDDITEARAILALAEADLARLAGGATAGDEGCAPPLEPAADHPQALLARAGIQRAEGEGEARRREGMLWLDTVDVEWDQVQATAGRVLVSVGIRLPSFADEEREADAGAEAARAGLSAAETAIEAEIRRLRAHLAAADTRISALEARPPPPELAILTEALRQRPTAPDTLALQAAAAQRDRRRVEARFAREEVLITLAFALGHR